MKLMWFHLMPYTELPAGFNPRTLELAQQLRDPEMLDVLRPWL